MNQDFFSDQNNDTSAGSNMPEYSVTEISHALKKTVEDRFNYIRVRGEISRVTVAKSGHCYTSLKDDKSVLDAICWKGNMARLSTQPEEGLEVICTGRLTTYPGRSNYQMIIETMELAGEGALLKMLEDRRKKLAGEGLFDDSLKKPIPFLPKIIGVVTSPTGAVIRDIMHRLNDRFPTHVLLFPAIVQGETAAKTIIQGIEAFNNITADHPLRPDLIIVARGGGSLEDLMPFNDEAVVRAAAASTLPLISAVGHETDTTLIDYASDLRAPTPTGAAEQSVPVRRDLYAQIMDDKRRLYSAIHRQIEHYKTHIEGLSRGLGNPSQLLENATQRLDHLSAKLDHSLSMGLEKRSSKIGQLSAGLSAKHIVQRITHDRQRLRDSEQRMTRALKTRMDQNQTKIENLSSLLESLSFKKILARGYSYVEDAKGAPVTSAEKLANGDQINIRFADGHIDATVGKNTPKSHKTQGELF